MSGVCGAGWQCALAGVWRAEKQQESASLAGTAEQPAMAGMPKAVEKSETRGQSEEAAQSAKSRDQEAFLEKMSLGGTREIQGAG